MTRKTTPAWPWGWIIDSDHFVDLLKRVFDNHEGHVWMFNSDLAIHRDRSHFEALYDGYIRANPKVVSVRFVLSAKRLKQFMSEPVYKWRFKDLPDGDIGKFLFRTLEEVEETHSHSPVFAEFLRTFAPIDEEGNENVLVFYTVNDSILNGDAVTIFRPTIYPFVAVDEHGTRRRRALAGHSLNWEIIARHCAAALQDVFNEEAKFSRLGVRRHVSGDIQEFVFKPPMPLLAGPPVSPVAVTTHRVGSTSSAAAPTTAPPRSGPGPQTEVMDLELLLRHRERIELGHYEIVPGYVRDDEGVRNVLRALQDEIGVVLRNADRWKDRNNYLIWAAPGTGKTAFVDALGAYLKGSFAAQHELKVKYLMRKLSDLDEAQLRAFIKEVKELLVDSSHRVLAFLDEVDKKPGESWPLTSMLGPLEWNAADGKPVVWLFAGSKAGNKDEFEEELARQPSGSDFLRRVQRPPTEISSLSVFDRALIACAHLIGQCPDITYVARDAVMFLAGAGGDAGEVMAKAAIAVRNLKQEPARTHVFLNHCVAFGSNAVDEFRSLYLAGLGVSGEVRIVPAVQQASQSGGRER